MRESHSPRISVVPAGRTTSPRLGIANHGQAQHETENDTGIIYNFKSFVFLEERFVT